MATRVCTKQVSELVWAFFSLIFFFLQIFTISFTVAKKPMEDIFSVDLLLVFLCFIFAGRF